jgi:orotate phosphoribosyltransferase-like protein
VFDRDPRSASKRDPLLKRATELFAEGLTVREVAATLRISKSEAGRLRLRAFADGILSPEDGPELSSQQITVQ